MSAPLLYVTQVNGKKSREGDVCVYIFNDLALINIDSGQVGGETGRWAGGRVEEGQVFKVYSSIR